MRIFEKNELMNYANYPILKLLLPYLCGVFIAYLLDLSLFFSFLSFWALIGLLPISILFCKINSQKWQQVGSVLLFILAFFLGLFTTIYHVGNILTEREKELTQSEQLWSVCIVDKPVEKAKSMKLVVEVERSLYGDNLERKAVVYIAKDSISKSLQYGDRLFINAQLSAIDPPRNPESFDLQQYLRRRSIYLTTYVPAHGWAKVGTVSLNILKSRAIQLQQKFALWFANSGLIDKEYDIITAILLGADETMDPELKAQYASAGVSHILCVSGMHVGIIFMIISFLLKPLDGTRRGKWVKTVVILLFIWFYAAITGFSPSVQRAAVMFSFASVGGILKRNTNIYHSLFASLFLLLILNPLLIFEIGFQLSYLAVFGIVLFQKRIFRLLKVKTRIVTYFWELASVSIAAQLTTFPIAIYYFGQFPNYFLISNLSVIFLSFVIMITGIITLVLTFIPLLSRMVGYLLTYEIKVMNTIIEFVDHLPGAVTENIYFSIMQVAMLYVLLWSIFLFFNYKNKKIFFLGLSCLALFSSDFVIQQLKNEKKREIVIYAIPKMSAIHFNAGSDAFLLADSIRNNEHVLYKQYIKNYERKYQLQSSFLTTDSSYFFHSFFQQKKQFLYFMGKRIYFLRSSDKLYHTNHRIDIDYLIIQQNPKISPERIEGIFNFQQIIIDGNNSYYHEKKWREWCVSHGIAYHSILESGSLTIPLK